jgi:uncharacterized protein YlxP (DUF503 family)
MVVGLCVIELHLPDNHSLKGKRQVIKSIKDRIRNKFNVSVAEIEHQQLWQRIGLGIAYVCNDRKKVDQTISCIINFVEGLNVAVIIDYDTEITNY